MLSEQLRAAEFAKYQRAYKRPKYRMGGPRMADAVRDLAALPVRGSYLDIGCGRGEMLNHAAALGFRPVQGTEIIPSLIDGTRVVYGECHALPFADRLFTVVTLLDVIEHLVPPDDEAVCREMARVSKSHILLTANNKSSLQPNGDQLHVNRRPYEQWDALFREWFDGAKVTWLKEHKYVSEGWVVELERS